MALLPTMSILTFILSDDSFWLILFYEKVNYCKIRNSIIKIAVSFDRKSFLVSIYASKIFSFYLRNINQNSITSAIFPYDIIY